MEEIRKLNTILFADIAGYTALMQSDEKMAMSHLKKFKETLEDCVPMHEGKIIQYFGDACLLSFDSTTSGVKCSISLQEAFINIGIPIRIGMHLGEVVFTDNNVFGDGVNIASRIESMGIPGSILISNAIRNQIKNKEEFKLVSLGSFDFKNISEPLEVFALGNEGLSIPEKSKIQGKFKETPKKSNKLLLYSGIFIILIVGFFIIKNFAGVDSSDPLNSSIDIRPNSIAVLPFININKQNENLEYFSDGVTQEIIDELAKINSIIVPAFATAFQYKDQTKSHSEIASELGVKYLMSGSSRLYDNNKRVKLSVELINPITNQRIWNSTFDEELSDAPSIQLAVAKEVAENLDIELTISEEKELEKPNTNSGEAFRLFLHAKAEINTLSPLGLENGAKYLEDALKLDPNYTQAHTLLAWRYTVGASPELTPGIRSSQESVALAKPYIDKALKLDPESSDTYLVRGNMKLYSQHKIQEAKEDVDLAVAINSWPRIPTNYCICTVVSTYIALGNVERAKEVGKLAKKVDPGHVLFDWDEGNLEMVDNNYPLAQKYYQIAVNKAPIPLFQTFLGWSYYYGEQYEEALELLDLAYKNSPLPGRFTVSTLSNTYLKMGNKEKSDQYLQELLDRDRAGEHHLNLMIADIYLERNEFEKSLDHLELGLQNSDWGFAVFLSQIPNFKKLEKEPRFQEIRKAIQYESI